MYKTTTAWLQPSHQQWFPPCSFTVQSLFMLWVIYLFYFGALWWGLTCFDVWCPFSVLSICLHFSSPPWQPMPTFSLLFWFVKVLAGMNVHPAEFDTLKQEYNVKGYPTFCYFEWVEPSHLSYFKLIPHFQGLQHLSGDTSNRKHSPQTWWLQTCTLQRWFSGSELASVRCKGESFFQVLESCYSFWKHKLAGLTVCSNA